MPLRLFRTTGYSTLLLPGEARLPMHPSCLVLAVSLWLALACNVGAWRLLAGSDELRSVLAGTALVAGGSGMLLSLLGWRRTLKPTATLLLLVGGLLACGLWLQDLPVASLWQERPRTLLPTWASFMRARVILLVLVLSVLPIVWVWSVSVRRLPGPSQLQANLVGALVSAAFTAAGLYWLP